MLTSLQTVRSLSRSNSATSATLSSTDRDDNVVSDIDPLPSGGLLNLPHEQGSALEARQTTANRDKAWLSPHEA